MSTYILNWGIKPLNNHCSNYRRNMRTARASPQLVRSRADDTISYGTLRGRRSSGKWWQSSPCAAPIGRRGYERKEKVAAGR